MEYPSTSSSTSSESQPWSEGSTHICRFGLELDHEAISCRHRGPSVRVPHLLWCRLFFLYIALSPHHEHHGTCIQCAMCGSSSSRGTVDVDYRTCISDHDQISPSIRMKTKSSRNRVGQWDSTVVLGTYLGRLAHMACQADVGLFVLIFDLILILIFLFL